AAAVDAALVALTRQVRQLKDRLRAHKPAARQGLPPVGSDGDSAPPELDIQQVPVKPMSVQEALEQFGPSRDPFFAFTNARTETVNVLYRRRGGGFGLIEPVA